MPTNTDSNGRAVAVGPRVKGDVDEDPPDDHPIGEWRRKGGEWTHDPRPVDSGLSGMTDAEIAAALRDRRQSSAAVLAYLLDEGRL